MADVIDRAPDAAGEAERKALIRKVHAGAKWLHMADDDRRALMERLTGKRSAADCAGWQLSIIVLEIDKLAGAGSRRPAPASHPVARKARALWISLRHLGALTDGSERALEAFARRQLGIDRLQWANQSQGYRLIEALKAIAVRHGWDQTVPSGMSPPAQVRLLKRRLVGAMLTKLATGGIIMAGPIAADREGWSDAELDDAVRHLAGTIRDMEAAPAAI